MQILAKDQNKVWNLRLLKLISTRLIFVQRSRQLVLTHDDSGLSIIDRNVCFKINKSEVKSLHPTPLMRVVAIDQGHHRRDGVVVRASASQSVDLGFIP